VVSAGSADWAGRLAETAVMQSATDGIHTAHVGFKSLSIKNVR
jgi:hypothetical protein